MRTFHILLFAVFFSFTFLFAPDNGNAQPGAESAVAKELKKFQGKWQCIKFSVNGVEAPDDQIKATTITFKGNKFTLKTKKNTIKGSVTLDLKQDPRNADAVIMGDDGKKTKLEGIYAWIEGRRKTCLALPGFQRPGSFLQQQGYVVMEWEKKTKKN